MIVTVFIINHCFRNIAMSNDKGSFFANLRSLFTTSKDSNPQEKLLALAGKKDRIDEHIHGIEFDLKKEGKRLQGLIQEGKNAALQNDQTQVRRVATKIQFQKVKISDLQKEHKKTTLGQFLVEQALWKSRAAQDGGVRETLQESINILDDEDVKEWIRREDITSDLLYENLTRKFDLAMAKSDEHDSDSDHELSEVETLLYEAANAERSGDQQRASDANARLSGEPADQVAEEPDPFA